MTPTLPVRRTGRAPRAFWAGAAMLALSALLGSAQGLAAAPPANTVIGNQASATYLDPNGASQQATSNLVQTTVQQVGSFTLDGYGSVTTNVVNTKTGAAGATVYAPHVLTNTGNGSDTFTLKVEAPTAPNGFSKVEVFADANADGLPDSTTALCSVTPATTCNVPAQTVAGSNGTFPFVVAYTIPNTATSSSFTSPVAATITATPGTPTLYAASNQSAADVDNVIRTDGPNGTVVSSTASATTAGSGSTVTAGTGTTGDFYTVPGTLYTLTETGTGGANVANYKATLTCSDAAGVTPAANLPNNEPFNTAIGRAIMAPTGANLRCVITNSPGTPTVSGRVFLDNGQGGGTANDGILNGGEGPLAGVAMRLTNCAATVHATAVTDAAGGYSLGVPAGVASGSALCVEEANPGSRVSTGASVDGTALPSGSATTVAGIAYTYTRSGPPERIAFAWNGIGQAGLNFGDVDNATFAVGSAKTGLPGNTLTYAHTFTAGTAGQVRFSIPGATASPSITGWSETIFADTGCTGSLQPGAVQLYPPTGAATAVAFAEKVCIVVREFIPATAPLGASNKVTVRADFDYANAAPALAASFTLEDVTTVSSVGLELKKEVRNVTQAGSFGINNQAKSGETLEYRITFTNNSDAPVSSMTVNDATPGYTSFVSAGVGALPGTLTACTKNTPANALPAPAVPCADAQAAGGTGPIDWKFTGTVAPGGSGTVVFRVKVD